jgi:pyrroloquinoline-quinone synthase
MSTETWWNEVEEIIQSRKLVDHPYNVAWREGRLKVEDVWTYCKQYFRHVDAFPRYVSAVHSNTPDMPTRQMLLENLNEEEGGTENHPELFLRFGEGAGVARDEVVAADARAETTACVDTFMSLARNPNHLVGLAALYAYESQQHELSGVKVKNLDVHYGIMDEKAYEFFKVHIAADVWHSYTERKAIMAAAKTEADREAVKAAVTQACDAVYAMFDGIVKDCVAPIAA